MNVPKVRLIHETNPEKYFPALYYMHSAGEINIVGSHRYSVVKEWARAWLRDRTNFMSRTKNAMSDVALRMKLASLNDEVIVLGFAPWDWRIILYKGLAERNKIIYHTSWHDWGVNSTPRQPVPAALKSRLVKIWEDFLKHPNVEVVSVTNEVSESLLSNLSVNSRVIPHAVPREFFDAGKIRHKRQQGNSLRILFVGEISEKKGVKVLLDLFSEMSHENMELTLVGRGPLQEYAASLGGKVKYLGSIKDRTKMAEVMSEHDVLVLLSQKTQTWEELFGIVVVEAIASGCAVIASDHIGPRGILAPVGGEGIFAQNDREGVRNTLLSMAMDGDSAECLHARQLPAVESYLIDQVVDNWRQVILAKAD